MEDNGYACPLCGGWFEKGEHSHPVFLGPSVQKGCDHCYCIEDSGTTTNPHKKCCKCGDKTQSYAAF